MLRRTSKRVKEVVDKMRLPVVVRLRWSFWNDARNGTAAEKLQLVMRQLTVATARCLIITLELPHCDMKGQDAVVAGVLAQNLAGVLAQRPALTHLDLSYNCIIGGPGGAEILAEVLGQCLPLAHLDLKGNNFVAGGAKRLAGVLGQCRELVRLNLSRNQIGPAGAERLAGVLAQCPALAHLNLGCNRIALSVEGGFELRCVVKLLTLSWGKWSTGGPVSVSNYGLQLIAKRTFSRRVTLGVSRGCC